MADLSSPRPHEILEVTGGSDETDNLKSEGFDVLFNPMLAVKVMHILIFPSGSFFDFGKGTPDIVFDADLFGNIGNESALFLLSDICDFFEGMREIVCEGVEAISTIQRFLKARLVREVALLEINVSSNFEKFLCRGLVGIACQCTDLPDQDIIEDIPESRDCLRVLSQPIRLGCLAISPYPWGYEYQWLQLRR